jgi:TonB family protein
MIREYSLIHTGGVGRRPLVISIGVHAAIFLLVLLSPLIWKKSAHLQATKFFQVVSVQAYRPRVSAGAEPKPQVKPATPKKAAQKAKPAPALSAKVDKSFSKEPAFAEEEQKEYVLPSEVSVGNPGFQYDWYIAHIRSQVERYWDPPRGIPGSEDLHVLVVFNIESNGEVTAIRLEGNSGDETLDRLGFRAIERAAPFPRLPPRFVEQKLEVHFKLNYIR